MKATKPYKGDNGQWLSASLFKESSDFQKLKGKGVIYQPLFSLYSDVDGLINCRKTFIEEGDPSGYKWAMKYLGDYSHWLYLMKRTWFKEAYSVWMNELQMKLEAEALDAIREIAKDSSNKSQLPAARYLHSLSKTSKSSVGRPKKETEEVQTNLDDFDLDAERIGLTLIKGGKT